MSRAAENKLAKRMRILDAAYDLFTKKGIDTTPIDEVVKGAGVAKGTFYLYFRDKHDLIDQLVLTRFSLFSHSLIEKWKADGDENESCLHKYQRLIDVLIEKMKQNQKILPLIDGSFLNYSKLLIENNPEIKQTFSEIYALLEQKGYTLAAAEKYVSLINEMLFKLVSSCILSSSPCPIDEAKNEIRTITDKLFA